MSAPARAAAPPLDTPYLDGTCMCVFWLPAQPYEVRRQEQTSPRGARETEVHVDAVSPDRSLDINLVYWRQPPGEPVEANHVMANNVAVLAGRGYRFLRARPGSRHGGPALAADFAAIQSGALYPTLTVALTVVGDRVIVVQVAGDNRADTDAEFARFDAMFQIG
jgi:hypothetical protein